jgi:transcription elongation factor GreA
MDSPTTLGQAVGDYVSTLTYEERAGHQGELNRFVLFFGARSDINRITAAEVESYQAQVQLSGVDPAVRLDPVRRLLAFAHKKKITSINLAKVLKSRRTPTRSKAQRAQSRANEEGVSQVTSEGYAELKKELEYLSTEVRAEIAQLLYDARLDRDIRENAPYDAAKQRQGEVEARIRLISQTLATSRVVDHAQTEGDRIGIGTHIVLQDLTHGGEITYTLVGSSEANPSAGKLSNESPVGKASIGRRVGEEFEVPAPAGIIRYKVARVN